MEFRKFIKEKYQSEVKINFTDDNWDTFLVHREKHKKRPRGALFFFLGAGAITLLAGLWWTTNSTLESASMVNEINTETQAKSAEQAKSIEKHLYSTNLSTDKAHSTTAESASTSDLPALNKMSNSASINNVIDRLADEYLPVHSTAQNPFATKTESPISTETLPHQINHIMVDSKPLLSSGSTFKNSRSKSASSEHQITDHPLSLPDKEFSVSSNTTISLHSESSPIDISQDSRWPPKQISLALYGGLAMAFQIGTLDEQMHQFGAQIRYNLTPRIRAKFGLEFSAVDFVATEMNPEIGIDFVESPSDLVTFSEAVVESAGINLDLGIDYLIWRNKHFNIFAGASYRLSKEILKGIEYEFSGDDDSGSDDDIFISSDKSSRYFEPINLNLSFGISYQVKNNGFNLSLGRPIQLSRKKVNLLNQMQFNFGIIRQF